MEPTEKNQKLSEDLQSGAKEDTRYTGQTPRAIYHLVEQGHLPVIRMGRKLFFRKSELEQAFKSEGSQ